MTDVEGTQEREPEIQMKGIEKPRLVREKIVESSDLSVSKLQGANWVQANARGRG